MSELARDAIQAEQSSSSYLSPKCYVAHASEKGGRAVFAAEAIEPGELIAVWSGRLVTLAQFEKLPLEFRRHTVQVEEGLYLTSLAPDEAPDYVNHSCDPNAGLSGQIALVAMKAIAAGAEITFDYAMSDGSAYDEFPCACGAVTCRRRVTGEDWRQPALWARYEGFFSPYLQRRIDRLRKARRPKTQ